MTILAAHQPAYLPWLGYFDKIARSDVFVYMDSVQFEKNSFTNRNKIKTQQGPVWLTVPVLTKGHTGETMCDTRVDNKQNWKSKHLKSIQMNYRKAPRFEACYPRLEELYRRDYEVLADMCYDHLLFWLAELGIQRGIHRLSTLGINSRKSELVLDMCRCFKADRYLSGALGRDYLKEEDFTRENIAVEYQDFSHPVYQQLYGDFVPYMGIIDFWMNSGDAGFLLGGR